MKFPTRLVSQEVHKPPPMTKVCGRCQEAKPKFAFNASKTQKDKLQSYCRTCQHAAATSRRAQRKADLATVGVKVEAQLCHACRTHRSAEYFARDPAQRNGLDLVCRFCRPYLEREKGVRAHEPCCKLTDVEVMALVLLRKAQATAKRKKVEFAIDWTWLLDRLEAGICEDTGDPFDVRKRGRGKKGLQIKPYSMKYGFVESNCVLVVGSPPRDEEE